MVTAGLRPTPPPCDQEGTSNPNPDLGLALPQAWALQGRVSEQDGGWVVVPVTELPCSIWPCHLAQSGLQLGPLPVSRAIVP